MFTTALIFHKDSKLACPCKRPLFSCLLFSSVWHCNVCRAVSAGFCVTEEYQRESEQLPGFVIKNTSLLCQSPTAGTYNPVYFIPLVARCVSLKLFNENESSADWVLVANWSSTVTESSRPVSLLCASLAVNQSDADAVETVLWTETRYSFHFSIEGKQGWEAGTKIFSFIVCCTQQVDEVIRCVWAKSKEG